MITYAQLAAADTAEWRAVGGAWLRLASSIDDSEHVIVGSGRDLRTNWSGAAATAATSRVAEIGQRLSEFRVPFAQVEQVLAAHAEAIGRARAMLAAGVAGTEGTRVSVTPEGGVVLDVTGQPPAPWEAALAGRTAERISAALALANRVDVDTSRVLIELAIGAETQWTNPPPSCPPGGGAGAGAVKLWWAGLMPAQRRWLIANQPEAIGALDGVPAADRDLANREWLVRERTRLSTLRDGIRGHPGAEDELARIDARLSGLAVVEGRLGVADPRAYLLGLDTLGDGKVILALGDPDHADNVLTFVPGAGCALDQGISGSIERTATMGAAANAADPTLRTSSILWLDYDSPEFAEAVSSSRAHDARAALHDFQAGLAITHEGEIGQQTVVGHSYGTLVIGETARDLGLAADDVVFLGSPGVGVEHAADLHVNPDTVWSSHADHDPIQYAAPSLRQILKDLPIGRYYGDPMTYLWHGHNPSDAGFGGHVFASADGGPLAHAHSSYWDSGNPALHTIGTIASGHDDKLK